jgi:hypothetical protein
MDRPLPPGLKKFFLLHAIVGTPFGILYMVPSFHGPLIGMVITEPVMHRLFGMAIVALSFGPFLASRRALWEQVNIMVLVELLFTTVVAVIVLHALLTGAFPRAIWLDLFIVIALIIGYGYFYLRMRGDRDER